MGKRYKALLMAGGTGGHVFPALATAEKLQQQEVDVEWLGSCKGMEAELIGKTEIPFHAIQVSGLRGKGKLSLLLAPFKILLAIWQAVKVLRKVKPDVVLGMGGFASGPGGVAAWLLGVPLLVHEQNAVAGMTNKILSRFACQVLEAFQRAFPEGVKTRSVGNPVRGNIHNLAAPLERYGQRSGVLRVLVVGGSLGAQAINELLPKVLAKIPEDKRPEVWHQTGKRNYEATLAAYTAAGLNEIKVVPFIDAMDEAYGWADLVLCRAGALTVSELSIAGVASVLVPFPFAVDDHQTKNAEFLQQTGAAEMIQQKDLSEIRLLELLTERMADRQQLLSMAEKAREIAQPDAGDQVAKLCIEAINK